MNTNKKTCQPRNESFADLLEKYLPDRSHKRYSFYKTYALQGISRGEQIYTLLNNYIAIDGKRVLDIGCGFGGITQYFSRHCSLAVGIDPDIAHLQAAKLWSRENGSRINILLAAAEYLPFGRGHFDIILLNDVAEHVNDVRMLARECSRVLSGGGRVYLTAGNRFSILNIFADPHFGYFGLVLLPKKIARWYLTFIRRKSFGYNVTSYPGGRFLAKIFSEQGITLRRSNLIEKFNNPSLIASDYARALVGRISRNRFAKAMIAGGLLCPVFFLYSRIISRGFVLIGDKK